MVFLSIDLYELPPVLGYQSTTPHPVEQVVDDNIVVLSLRDFSPIPTTRQTCLVVLPPAHAPIVKTGEQGPFRWGTKDTTVIIVKFDPLLSQLVDVRRLNQLLPIVTQQAGPQIKHRQKDAAESANELAY